MFVLCIGIAGAGFAQDDDPCKQTMDKNSEKIFKKARDFHKSGKKDEAYELYEEILADHPEYLEVNYYYALGYYLPLKDNQFYSKRKDKSDVTKALAAFNRELLAEHIKTCVANDIRAGKDETIDELVATLQKMMK